MCGVGSLSSVPRGTSMIHSNINSRHIGSRRGEGRWRRWFASFAILYVGINLFLSQASLSPYKSPAQSDEEKYDSSLRPIRVLNIDLDIDKICPQSSAINTINSSSPPSQMMSIAKLQSIVKHWHEINCPEKNTCQFSSIGQHLLHLAMKWNQTLLTVQVGAMDGRSNDPMYGMFVKTRGKNYVQAREIVPGKDSLFPDLRNWLPVMIEPVPKNYEDMKQTYLEVANETGLGCAVPINAAVSYDSEKSSCAFCRVNTAEDSPQRCKGKLSFHKISRSKSRRESWFHVHPHF